MFSIGISYLSKILDKFKIGKINKFKTSKDTDGREEIDPLDIYDENRFSSDNESVNSSESLPSKGVKRTRNFSAMFQS